jgi:hypothetical protein
MFRSNTQVNGAPVGRDDGGCGRVATLMLLPHHASQGLDHSRGFDSPCATYKPMRML